MVPARVHVLVNVGFDVPLRRLRRRWDGALAACLDVSSYQSLLVRRHVSAGTYVFADLDRVPSGDREDVNGLWDALAASGAAHLANDPRRVLLRYPLLRRLAELGINDFTVYRPDDDLSAVRYPVFVRCEHDHGGPRTPLLHNREDLEGAIRRLRTRRAWRSELIVTECAAEPDEDGLFRKYGALLIDGCVLPWHVIASRTWLVKGASRVRTERTREEQRRYIVENPHADRLRAIFAAAGIDYGRIDYAVSGGRLRVFEINTNPSIGGSGRGQSRPGGRAASDVSVRRLMDAFTSLASRCPAPGVLIPLAARRSKVAGWAYRGIRRSQSLLSRYAHRPGTM